MFFILILCALQGVHGSNSKNEGGKLKKLLKTCLIILFANEISNGRNRNVSQSNALACKYSVPDQNAMAVMNFAVCAKDPDFEKYLIDNSENCSKIKNVYDKAKSAAKCFAKVPTIIFNGVLAKFRGEQLSPKANVKMVKAYLNHVLGQEMSLDFNTEEIASMILQGISKKKAKKDFQFFRFTHNLDLTKEVFPGSASEKFGAALVMALDKAYLGDADAKHVKAILELTKLKNPENEKFAVLEAFEVRHKDINANQVKRLFEITKLMTEDDTVALEAAMHCDYKEIDVDNAKNLLKLANLATLDAYGRKKMTFQEIQDARKTAAYTTLTKYKDVNANHAKNLFQLKKVQYPDNVHFAAKEALNPKYKNVNVEEVYRKYQTLKKSTPQAVSEKEIMNKAFKVTYPEILKEDI